MYQFVRFRVDDEARFDALRHVFDAIKAVKNSEYSANPSQGVPEYYDLDLLKALMPVEVRSNFDWPVDGEDDGKLDSSRPVAISPPGTFLGARWQIGRVLDTVDVCEYTLISCERVSEDTGELQVDPHSYPYGGLNGLIALAEGFGFKVVGVNECGKYEAFGDAG